MSLRVARAVLSGCLAALQWMLWVTCALLAVLFAIAVMHIQGESPLGSIAVGIVTAALGGWLCGRIARFVEAIFSTETMMAVEDRIGAEPPGRYSLLGKKAP
jgi:hypothetical protein